MDMQMLFPNKHLCAAALVEISVVSSEYIALLDSNGELIWKKKVRKLMVSDKCQRCMFTDWELDTNTWCI